MSFQSVARVYADFNQTQPSEYYDYLNYDLEFHPLEDFELVKHLASGKFSEIYEAINVKEDKRYLVKIKKVVRMKKLKKEAKILENLKDGTNVLKLVIAVKGSETDPPAFVFEYFTTTTLKKICMNLSNMDIRLYMLKLLDALDFCHSRGIMHRDVRPENILICQTRKTIKLIGFRVSEFYHPGRKYNIKMGLRYYKSPELLLKFEMYDYSVDMWSFGCVLATLMFKKLPFFQGECNEDQLFRIVDILGTKAFYSYIRSYDIEYKPHPKLMISTKPKSFRAFITPENINLVFPEGIDLLNKILKYNHSERLVAKEAKEHGYFNPVRHLVR